MIITETSDADWTKNLGEILRIVRRPCPLDGNLSGYRFSHVTEAAA